MSRRAPLGHGVALGAVPFTGGQIALAQEPPLATPHPLGPAVPPELTDFAADWPTAQGNLAAHRAAADAPITATMVDRLQVAWRCPIAAVGGYGAVTTIQLVAGETVYLQDMESNVFALNRASGEIRWQHDYGMPTAGANGVAVGYGLVFGAIGIGAESFALDAASGKEVWRVKLSANRAEFIFTQPLVYDSVVYVASSPAA